MPERFELTYTGADNAEHRPVMIHRALFGSFERFIGILLEHYAGELPLWLAPVQAIVLPVSDRYNDYAAQRRASSSASAGLRVELDDRGESVARKIRDAELRKIPYMLVVGEREPADGSVSVRERRSGDAGAVDQELHAAARESERLRGAAILGRRLPSIARPCLGTAILGRLDARTLNRRAQPSLRAVTASAGPSQVRPAPARAGPDQDQRAHPRSRGSPDRR